MHLRPALLTAVVATTLLVPVAADAHPAGRPNGATTTDATHDVVYATFDGDVVKPGGTAPNRSNADISTVRVTYRKGVVTIVTTFRELGRVGQRQSYGYRFRTPSGPSQEYSVFVATKPGDWRGAITVYHGGTRPACGVRSSISYTRNVVTTVVPGACLGSPRWVRTGSAVATQVGDRVYYDDGLVNGGSYADPITLGPRLYR